MRMRTRVRLFQKSGWGCIKPFAQMQKEARRSLTTGAKLEGRRWTFRRLVDMVILVLRVFGVPGASPTRQQSVLGPQSTSTTRVKSPTKSRGRSTKRQPSLLELSQPESWQHLNRSIQQRLQYPQPSTAQREEAEEQRSVLSEGVRDTLCNSPWTRTPGHVEQAVQELQFCKDFKDYPLPIQRSLCKVGWYLCLENGRVVFKEGHQASCFYFLLSGTVLVTSEGDAIVPLTAGASFGDQAIIDGCSRTMTCTVKDQTELLAISKSDYLDLSLRQARLSYQKTKHFAFCQSVSLLKYWPVHLLEVHPDQCKLVNFKSNTVVVKDSKKNPWVYVIMAGSCRVVKRFVDGGEHMRARKHHQTHPTDFPTSKLALAGESLATRQTAVDPSAQRHPPMWKQNPLSQELHSRKGHVRSHPHTIATPHAVSERQPVPLSPKKQFLVQLQLLQPKDTFGLSSIVYPDEPSVTLVSNGAEMVMLSKEFILQHFNETIRNKLKRQITKFPSQEAMLKRIREHYTWNLYKQSMAAQSRRRV